MTCCKAISYISLCFLFVLLSSNNLSAQDIHFSQFYASPLTLNPALTGYSEGTYRATGIYRNQWSSVTTPYITYAASFDMAVLRDKTGADVFGVGGMVANDQSGNGSLNHLRVMGSSSYHKQVGDGHYLGAGVQLGYVQKSIQPNDLTFPSQYTGSGFDSDQANQENFESTTINYFDMQVGIQWNGTISDRLGLFNGASLFHLTQPKESFLGEDVSLASRYVVNGGARIQTSDKIYLTPNYIYMFQNQAQEINVGTAVEYHFQDKKINPIVSLGGWYRPGDAVIASASVEYKQVKVGASYDVNVSGLSEVSNNRGGFEISVTYIGKIIKPDTGPVMVPCPRL